MLVGMQAYGQRCSKLTLTALEMKELRKKEGYELHVRSSYAPLGNLSMSETLSGPHGNFRKGQQAK